MNGRTWSAFIALGVIWGLPYFFIKLAVQELSPFVLAWARIGLAAGILLPVAWRRGAMRGLGRHWRPICAFALVEFVGPFCAISLGERWIASSIAGILIAMAPLTIVVLSRWFALHEHLGLRRLAGLVLGLAGVTTLLGFGTVSGAQAWAGVACLTLATVGYSLGPLIIQRHLHGLEGLGPLTFSLCVAFVILTLPAMLTWPARLPSAVALSSIAVLGVMCTAVAMLLMFYLVSHAGAARASVITYINPIVATLMGVLILHEHLGLSGYCACALILLGSWLATRGDPKPGSGENQVAH